MPERPYVLLSSAVSVDGHIDDATDQRLLLSSDADFDRVDEVRASSDAVLVGATTIRVDDPRLLVRSPVRQAERVARGLAASPLKATVTRSGHLDPSARFFTTGDGAKVVYAATQAVDLVRARLGRVATVVDAGQPVRIGRVLADLAGRGVARLMVEGGSQVHTWFLTSGVVDELQLVVAPFFVGDPKAPRLVDAGAFPHGPDQPMRLAETRPMGDLVLLVYRLGGSDRSDRSVRSDRRGRRADG